MHFVACNLLGPSEAHFGLGNQMFGAAATLSYAKDTQQDALFPCLTNRGKHGSYVDNIFRELCVRIPDHAPQHFYKEPSFRHVPIPAKNNILLEGYFQSEKYFKHNGDFIRNTFTATEELERYINLKYYRLLDMKNTVSVHIRRGDYTTKFKGCFALLDNEYYDKAFAQFSKDSIFVFFGEHPQDLEYCRNKFTTEKAFYVQGESDVVDLLLMSKMKNNIIANSSFSWWAAWLNQNKGKKVIAPQAWFGSAHPTLSNSDEVTQDLIPEEWERI